ncbi:MAG: hypothetical protein KF831_11375 [Acidobacteria bacterium]|nr:hypothetical protein [Acidobacteriota bacterium]HCA56484.1 hypothetical protein [Blastocatellia bacterium]
MRFARYTFAIAGIYGIIALVPQYFLEKQIGIDSPPAITHPEYFYGFIGVALAFQVVFLTIARDPVRFRLIMPAAVLEKIVFVIPTFYLYFNGQAPWQITAGAAIDLLLAILFAIAFIRTPKQ